MRMKPWHLVAVAAFAVACAKKRAEPDELEGPVGAGDPNPEPEEPLEPVRDLYVFVHDRLLIGPALAAARRIKAASGITVHVNEHGTQATGLPIFGSDFLCGSGTEGRAGPWGIAMARDCNADPELVLLHELLHQLGVGHLALPERGVMNDARDGPLAKLTEADLTALCAVRHCSAFKPEA